MTIKDAIKILKNYHNGYFGYKIDDVKKAHNLAIKALSERPQGDWVRKEDIIRYIATQYSEHNELVPVWLNIGDLKGGVE